MKPQPRKPNPPLSKPAGKTITVSHRIAPPLPTSAPAKVPAKPVTASKAPPKALKASTAPAKPSKAREDDAGMEDAMSDHEIISTITDPVRWRILSTLNGQKTTQEIADALDLKSPNVQYHLKNLVRAGVVIEEQNPEHKRRLLYRRRNLTAQVEIEDGEIRAQVFFE